MEMMTNGCRKDASLAVIRSFAPARIERELLAQVFEIVQQRAIEPDGNAHRSGSTVAPRPENETVSQETNHHQLLVQEPAA